MNDLEEARRALTEREWRCPPEWLAARGVGNDRVLAAWQASTDTREMLRVLEHLSHVQSQCGVFLARAMKTVEVDEVTGRSILTGADDWRYEPTGLFRVRFMGRDSSHVEFEGDDELVGEVRARFPVVTVADVLDERCRIINLAAGA